MMVEAAKTTEQEQWVAVHRSGHVMDITGMRLVRILNTLGAGSLGIRTSLKDPACVLNVSAYPGVVEALMDVVALSLPTCTLNPEDVLKRAHAVLSLVHPPQGDTT